MNIPPQIPPDMHGYIALQNALAMAWPQFQSPIEGPAMTIITAAGALHRMGLTDQSIRDLLERAIAGFPKLDQTVKNGTM